MIAAHRRHGERRDARELRGDARALRAALPHRSRRSSPTTCIPSTSSTKFALAPRPAEGRRAAPPRAHRERDGRARRARPVVGVAFDGTGYGTDGTIWGGEVLVRRLGRLRARRAPARRCPMPGGAAAIRRPARMALGLLAGVDEGCSTIPGRNDLARATGRDRGRDVLLTMIGRAFNSPLTSSMGRLFDAVASIIGVRDDARLRGAGRDRARGDRRPSRSRKLRVRASRDRSPIVIDSEPVLARILDDVAAGVPVPVISHALPPGCRRRYSTNRSQRGGRGPAAPTSRSRAACS